MAYGANKMGSAKKGGGGNAKGFNAVRYEDRGQKKGEQYGNYKYNRASTSAQYGSKAYNGKY